MSLLIDGAPTTVDIDGKPYCINTDFRVAILFEQLMQEPNLSDGQKISQALTLYFPEIPHNISIAIDKLVWFYRCGKETHAQHGTTNAAPVYSLEQDGEYIYAAFLKDYGIDLEAQTLHWWKFEALISSLNSDNLFCKIIEWRSADTKKLKGEQRAFYLKMKRLYALKHPQINSSADDALANALQNGDDVSKYLKA
ncbi:MAG: bacteriophage Gp15 family protein [Oscillospiraceae bacterium]